MFLFQQKFIITSNYFFQNEICIINLINSIKLNKVILYSTKINIYQKLV